MNGTQNEKFDTLLSNSLAFIIFIKLEISHLFSDKAVFVSFELLKSIFRKLSFNFICRGKINASFSLFSCVFIRIAKCSS